MPREEPFRKGCVKVVPAQGRVAVRGDHLKRPLEAVHQAHVQRAPTQVKNKDELVAAHAGGCGCQGGCDGLCSVTD